MKQFRLNAFDMACVGHIQHGLWTHPRDRSTEYASLDHWLSLARTLEAAGFDALFLADVLGVYDVLGGTPEAAIRNAVQVPLIDPVPLIPAMASVTATLGFGVTCNLAYEQPFAFARRMSTLDHLTGGRVGWNIVTGYLDSAARATGHSAIMAHDDRYDLAEEFMDAVYALWEGSWADDAVRADRAAALYADPARIRPVHHHGKQYRIDAMHLCAPSPQRTPVLYQAGASERGRAFAARHAECIFVNPSTPAHVRTLVADLRARAAPRPLKVYVGATVVVGRTAKEAADKYEDYRRHVSVRGALAHAAASLGIDFDAFAPDEPVRAPDNAIGIKSNIDAVSKQLGPDWTVRDLERHFVLGARQKPIVGSPQEVADRLIEWAEQADIDGFNLARTVIPECLEDVGALLTPILRERGALAPAGQGTYRQRLFGAGDRLAAPHPAALHRW
ncbi:MAG: LLM class flavin-dependent oxidoreductase [Proteobacteria bacterium]|nr:LLM class flavin-dependent oxidoreductase [Pseudomonadota bacterium]